jgi:hypothetical protein
MTLPTLVIGLVPHVLHLAGVLGWQGLGLVRLVLLFGFAYLSWYVALKGLQTTPAIAFAVMLADYAASFGLSTLLG